MEVPHLFLQEPHRVGERRCPERIAADQLPEKGSMMGRRLIANGGSVVEPSLLLDTPSGSTTNLLSGTTANKLRDMMNYNVSAHYGTNRFPGLNLCAKTGTAEVGDGTSHAWFTGFLLDDAHPYAFVVLVENAGGGLTNAGAVANTVLQAAVNK